MTGENLDYLKHRDQHMQNFMKNRCNNKLLKESQGTRNKVQRDIENAKTIF